MWTPDFLNENFSLKRQLNTYLFKQSPSFSLSFSTGKAYLWHLTIVSWKELTEQLDKDRGITGATEGDGGGGYGSGWRFWRFCFFFWRTTIVDVDMHYVMNYVYIYIYACIYIYLYIYIYVYVSLNRNQLLAHPTNNDHLCPHQWPGSDSASESTSNTSERESSSRRLSPPAEGRKEKGGRVTTEPLGGMMGLELEVGLEEELACLEVAMSWIFEAFGILRMILENWSYDISCKQTTSAHRVHPQIHPFPSNLLQATPNTLPHILNPIPVVDQERASDDSITEWGTKLASIFVREDQGSIYRKMSAV